jgi:hypothetical protein
MHGHAYTDHSDLDAATDAELEAAELAHAQQLRADCTTCNETGAYYVQNTAWLAGEDCESQRLRLVLCDCLPADLRQLLEDVPSSAGYSF